jgi:hypothetical protein
MTTPMTPEVVPAHDIHDGIETAGWNVLFQTFDNPTHIRQRFFVTQDQAVRWAKWFGGRQLRRAEA